jgi:hypothetical protein
MVIDAGEDRSHQQSNNIVASMVQTRPKKRRGFSTVMVWICCSVTPMCFRYGITLWVVNSIPSGFNFSFAAMAPAPAIDIPKYQSFDRKILWQKSASMSFLTVCARRCHDRVFGFASAPSPTPQVRWSMPIVYPRLRRPVI